MSEGAKKKQKMDGYNFHNLIKKWKIFVHRMVGVMIACKLSLQQEWTALLIISMLDNLI